MTLCAHADEKTSIVRSNMTSTVYRLDCRDCGRIAYYTEVTVPDIFNKTYKLSENHD